MQQTTENAKENETSEQVETGAGESRRPGLWSTIREAVAGSERDYTEIGIGRAIILLSIPMVLEMAMESLFGIADVFFVSRLGADAVATVGITESLLTLIFALAMGLSMATTALVSRRIGEKDTEGAKRAAVQAIILGIVISVPIAIISVLFTRQFFGLMGASSEVIEIGAPYGMIVLGGNVVIMLLFLINAVFRGAGDAAVAMRALWLGNIINIILDPCLIFGWGPFPEWGVTGSAVATVIGRGVSVAYQFRVLFGKNSRIRLSLSDIAIDPDIIAKMIRISIGGILQYLVATASWLALVRLVAVFGSAAIAGYTIALRIIIFALLPSWGMSNAAATLVGQNLGAGKPQRAEKSVWITGFGNSVFLGLVAVVFIIFAEPLIHIFTTDAEVVSFGVSCLRYISYGYIFYAYGMIVVQAFNGAGDTFTPTLINLFCYWLFQIPLAYYLSMKAGFGAQGVFLAITIAESSLALVAVLAFRRGTWKTRQV
ncbi:MAG: MATE family efflux transporter [Blastocatellales bacterium]|nr:MATE family efflux transporter [Blastocatellales bacterium]